VRSIPADMNCRIAIWTKQITSERVRGNTPKSGEATGLTCAVASWQATRWNVKKSDVSGDGNWIRGGMGTHVWAQLEVADTTSDVLVLGVIQMTIEDLFGQGKRAL